MSSVDIQLHAALARAAAGAPHHELRRRVAALSHRYRTEQVDDATPGISRAVNWMLLLPQASLPLLQCSGADFRNWLRSADVILTSNTSPSRSSVSGISTPALPSAQIAR